MTTIFTPVRVIRARRSLPTSILFAAIGCVTFFWLFLFPVEQRDLGRRASSSFEGVSPHSPKASLESPNSRDDESNGARVKGYSRKTTIVSAFFDLAKVGQKTKHSPDFYLQAGRDGVLSFDSPMVFFTDSPVEVAKARSLSAPPGAETRIINMSLSAFEVVRAHLAEVNKLIPRDYEARSAGYSGLLFIIYHAKPEMMRIAAELNPFNTENFLWMDVGCVRDWGGISAKEFRRTKFPEPSTERYLGREGRILMSGVAGYEGPCKEHVRWVDPLGSRAATSPLAHLKDALETKAEPFSWWIAGAIWGGPGSKMREYESLYRVALKRYIGMDLPKYSLIDQYLMGALACSSDLVEVVKVPVKCCVDRVNRKWFFLLMFFSGKPIPDRPYEPGDKRSSRGKCRYCDD